MDFALTEEQAAIIDTVAAFGSRRIAPFARQWEAVGTIPRELWTEAAEIGLGGLFVPEKDGGAGFDRLTGTLVFQSLALACPSVAAFLSIHNMSAAMIARHASPDLKARVLPRAVSMEMVLSYCLTEPGVGSDAAALATKATRTTMGWRLDGAKAFISGGGYSDGYIVMARSGGPGARGISAFFVDKDISGLSFGALEEKMGWKAQPTRAALLDKCEIPNEICLETKEMVSHMRWLASMVGV